MFLKICTLSLVTIVVFLFSCSNSNIEDKINNNVVNTEKEVKDTIEYMITSCDGNNFGIGNSREKRIYLDSFEVSYSNFMNFCEPEICCEQALKLISSSLMQFFSSTYDLYIIISFTHKDEIRLPFTDELKKYYELIYGEDEISELEYKKIIDLKFKEYNGRKELEPKGKEKGYIKRVFIKYNSEYYFYLTFQSLQTFCPNNIKKKLKDQDTFDNLCYCFLENLEINLIE